MGANRKPRRANLTNDQRRFRLAVFGSRTLSGGPVIDAILKAIDEFNPTALVTSGEPHGVCEVARNAARELPLPLHLHFLDKMHRERGAWHWRSVAVYMDCDHVLLIHDGTSQGTANELALAIKMKVPYTYIKLEATDGGVDK
jgi:hypothetical protein